jgi:hypothetical protein
LPRIDASREAADRLLRALDGLLSTHGPEPRRRFQLTHRGGGRLQLQRQRGVGRRVDQPVAQLEVVQSFRHRVCAGDDLCPAHRVAVEGQHAVPHGLVQRLAMFLSVRA